MRYLILLTMMVSIFTVPSSAVIMDVSQFRLNQYIYYEILYRILKAPLADIVNAVVVSETSYKLVFTYNGEQFTADKLSNGAIFVDMPGERPDRYLTRRKQPALLLGHLAP